MRKGRLNGEGNDWERREREKGFRKRERERERWFGKKKLVNRF